MSEGKGNGGTHKKNLNCFYVKIADKKSYVILGVLTLLHSSPWPTQELITSLPPTLSSKPLNLNVDFKAM